MVLCGSLLVHSDAQGGMPGAPPGPLSLVVTPTGIFLVAVTLWLASPVVVTMIAACVSAETIGDL